MKISIDSFDIYPKVAFAGTRGSYGADAVLEFEFNESWKELSKCVIFYPADGSDAISILLGSDNTVKIPIDVMRAAGHAKYVVSGVKDEDIMISVTGDLHVAQTLDAAGTEPDAVVPSLAMQVISKVTDAERAASEAKAAAKQCGALIEEYVIDTESAKVSAESAKVSAENAKESADEAQKIKKETEEIKDMILPEEEQRQLAEAVRAENEEKRVRAESVRAEKYNKLSNALVGSASGETVKCEVSPIEHELGVSVEQINLVPYPYEDTDSVKNGITITRNGRSVSFDGKSTTGFSFALGNLSLKAGRYTIGGFSLHSSEEGSVRVRITKVGTSGFVLDENIANISSHKVSFDIAEAISEARLTVQFTYSGATYSGSMTPYLVKGEPVSDISSVKILKYGKNLLIEPTSLNKVTYENGIYTQSEPDTANRVLFMVQQIDGESIKAIAQANWLHAGNRYVITLDVVDASKDTMSFRIGISGAMINNTASYKMWLPAGTYTLSFDLFSEEQGSISWGNMMLEAGANVTEYDPHYVEPTEYTPNEDGTVEGVMSVYPTTTLICDTDGIIIDAIYNKDANKVVAFLEERIAALEAK